MSRRRVLTAAILVLGACAFAGTAVAQSEAGERDPASVFPVVPGGNATNGNVSQAGAMNRYTGVAGHPRRSTALVTAAGVPGVLRYSGSTFASYALGTRHAYLDAAWRRDGRWYLTGYAPREQRSSIWLADPSGVRRIRSSNVTLRAVDVGARGTVLVAGGRVAPMRGELLTVTPAGASRRVPLPAPAPLRDVAWSPGGDAAVAVGLDGTIYRYRDGAVTRVPGGDVAFLTAVAWIDDARFVAVGAEATNGTEPSGDGVVYLGNASGVRRTSSPDVVPRDLSWRPGGGSGLAVGGRAENATVYRIRPDGTVAGRSIDARTPVSVDWYGRHDALIAGGGELWRYSLRTTADALQTTASMTVSPRSPSPGDPIRLNGFGSTSHGSTGAVEAWQFVLGANVTDWQEIPVTTGRAERAGRFRAGVRVRATDGSVSPWNNATVVVGDPEAAEREERASAPLWLLMAVTSGVLVLYLGITALRRRSR